MGIAKAPGKFGVSGIHGRGGIQIQIGDHFTSNIAGMASSAKEKRMVNFVAVDAA